MEADGTGDVGLRHSGELGLQVSQPCLCPAIGVSKEFSVCVVGRIQIMPNGSLVIYDVTSEDSGKYTCIAGNSCNIKHREAFLYVVGKESAQGWDMTSWNPWQF